MRLEYVLAIKTLTHKYSVNRLRMAIRQLLYGKMKSPLLDSTYVTTHSLLTYRPLKKK